MKIQMSATEGLLRRLNAASPHAAAVLAERLFLTAWRFPQPTVEARALAEGRRYTVRYRFRGERRRVVTWTFGEGPAVLLAHGWSGRAGQMRALIAPLLARGLRVILFDAPGHGASPGRLSSLTEFAAAMRAIDRHLGPLRAVVGHSLGGTAAMLAVREGLRVERLVTLGSPASAVKAMQTFGERFALSPEVVALATARVEARYGVSFDELDLALGGNPRLPLLVVHDKADPDVPFDAAVRIAGAWPGAQLLATEGLGHKRVLRDKAVVDASTAFIADGLACEPRPELFPRYDLVSGRAAFA